MDISDRACAWRWSGSAFPHTTLSCSIHCLALFFRFWFPFSTPPCISNSFVPLSEANNSEVLLLTRRPKSLSSKLDDHLFKVIWTCPLSLTKLACCLFPSLMQHHGYLSLFQSFSVSKIDPSQFQVAISGGLAWMFPTVLAALCPEIALDPLGHHAVPAKGVVMWFLTTTNYMVSLQSPVGDLIWVSRWKWVAMSPPIIATLVLLTFWFQTGSWASQQLSICQSHPRLIPQLFWKPE